MDFEHEIFSTNNYLVRITNDRKLDSMGKMKVTWDWEITIAVKGTTYLGAAVEHSKNQRVGWVELESMQPLEEMIDYCKLHMKK